MTTKDDQAIRSGAQHVEEQEHLASGLSEPRDVSIAEIAPEDGSDGANLHTALAGLTLSMFEQGTSVRIRVGVPQNASELYEQVYPTADEANSAMLDGGILTADQVKDPTKPAGTHLTLINITTEQLEAAGLKRHTASTL